MIHAVPAIIFTALLLVGALLFQETLGRGVGLVTLLSKDSNWQTARRLSTSIQLKNVLAFDSGSCISLDAENTGSTTLSHLDRMDLIVNYPRPGNERVIERLVQDEGAGGCSDLGNNQWTVVSIDPDPTNPGLLDPGETMALESHISPQIPQGEQGVLILVVENGVGDQALFGY